MRNLKKVMCTCTEPGTDKYGNEIKPQKDDENEAIYARKQISQEEMKEYRSFVDAAGGVYGCDSKVWDIVSEESAAYFMGDKSIDDVCMIIQDRVSTYVNESK